MSDKFRYEVTDEGARYHIKMAGVIDEDVDFSGLPTDSKAEYYFDFDRVEAINSCGIREWVKYSESIPGEVKLVYVNCTQIIIEQINMVAGFFRKGSEVREFYAPYFCENCDEEKKVLISSANVENNEAPEMKCEACGEEMEFDALEEQYFRFLNMAA